MAYGVYGRLLCAAEHTYTVTRSGPAVVSVASEAAKIGYIGTPQGVLDGPGDGGLLDQLPIPVLQALLTALAKRDAATVGHTSTEIIVALRGTVPMSSGTAKTSALDWLNDTKAHLDPGPGGLGRVHRGFHQAVDNVWDELRPLMKKALQANPGLPVYFTGHSKGGGMAPIAGMRFLHEFGVKPHVCAFAGARPGDQAFAAAAAAALGDFRRYEFAHDPVPHLAPEDVVSDRLLEAPVIGHVIKKMGRGFASAGALYYIAAKGQAAELIPDPAAHYATRLDHLLAPAGVDPITRISDAHSLHPTQAYHMAICR